MRKHDRSQEKTFFLFFLGGLVLLFIAHFLVKSGMLGTETAADGVWVGMSGNYPPALSEEIKLPQGLTVWAVLILGRKLGKNQREGRWAEIF